MEEEDRREDLLSGKYHVTDPEGGQLGVTQGDLDERGKGMKIFHSVRAIHYTNPTFDL